MTMSKIGCPMRSVFAVMAALMWLGIFLTGFKNVSWVLYLPAIGVTVAAISGVCMGAMLFGKLCKTS
ncbi:MAG: hypothetical protein E6Q83_18335 [Thiothrix sp.]|nr:MAG: hypothetical protein E6Q83_18335 [Thiothrix sp.]